MRIAYLHYLVESDTGRHHARQFAAGARALGHQVDEHAMNLAPGAGGHPGGRPTLRDRLKKHLSYWLHEPKEILWNLPYARREQALIAAARPDVILVRDHLLTASCVPVARRLGLPLVLEMNSPADESRLYFGEYLHLPFVARALEGYKLRHADAVTVVSSTLGRLLADTYRIPEDRIRVVPNGADLDVFRPDTVPDPGMTRAAGDGPVIGFVGSFRRWHGTDLLVRMTVEVAAARPATRFLLVGDGPEAGAVRAALAPLGPRLVMTGRVPHARVPGLTAAFDIGVLPETLFYGSPLKVIEWMAAGRSIVAPGYPALGDIIENGTHALLFRPGDAADFTRTVLRLVDDPALRHRLGESAAARARGTLSWIDNATRVVAACHAAIRRRAGRAAPAGTPIDRRS
jgi:glycosyltransferase involved in cell wall biosynthesis